MSKDSKEQDLESREERQQVESELQNIIEAAIFSADEPLSMRQLIGLFPEDAQPSKDIVQEALDSLQNKYQTRGIELRKIGKGWRFQSKEKYASWLRKLSKEKTPRFSRALLETLAIIAYRQPVTRGDIEEVRGVSVSSDTIRTLQEREWVQEVGHRDVPGRPTLFATTQEFLEYFNLQSLRDLPELIKQRDISEIANEMSMQIPVDAFTDLNITEEQNTADVIPLHPEQAISEEEDLEQLDSEKENPEQTNEQSMAEELVSKERITEELAVTEQEPDDGETA